MFSVIHDTGKAISTGGAVPGSCIGTISHLAVSKYS